MCSRSFIRISISPLIRTASRRSRAALAAAGPKWTLRALRAPSREGDFLRKMLKDFKGVLVSDFYSSYDGLPCLHQRCLIHLIRDMNPEILDNPVDQELHSITVSFLAFLRPSA